MIINSIKAIVKKVLKWFKTFFLRTENIKLPILVTEKNKKIYRVTHISAFSYGNAGDTLLPVVLRDLFNQQIGIKEWYGVDVHRLVTKKDIYYYNQDDFIVIGGGGLFLCDTCPNDISGWQWNCSVSKLNKIKKPLIAFAIGYNRFRGQEDFKPIFTDHINAFIEKAAFVGLRNTGSIKQVTRYLKSDTNKEKIVFQPCPTTLIANIYPNYTNYLEKEDFIAFNCAFDRQNMRSLDEKCLTSIVKVALELSYHTKIKYYSHMESDKNILPYFERYSVPYELVEMHTVEDIVESYSKPRLVIGMRGHSQMIPFGCLTPIISIVSHDKMKWFLEDIHHPEWGCDVLSENFEKDMLNKSIQGYNNYEALIKNIITEQNKLWEITLKNMQTIKKILE